jgi:hypothetical protein
VRLAAALLVMLLAGCGASHHQRLSVSRDGKAVIRDALDGHLDRSWSCGSLRAAVDRLPSTPDQTIPLMIASAAGRACDAALGSVHRGQTRAEARVVLGSPDRASRCWLFRWPPQPKLFGRRRASLLRRRPRLVRPDGRPWLNRDSRSRGS